MTLLLSSTLTRPIRLLLVWLVACSGSLCVFAQSNENLARLGYYADPEIHIFEGQYWIYPTTSEPVPGANATRHFNALQQSLRRGPVVHPVYLLHTSLDAFSSPDLVHWTRHAHVLDTENVSWAAYALWAPSAIHLNGRYYLFFGANDIQKTDTFPGGIGVAVSDSPGGPFRDLLGHPLIGQFHNGAQPIDPMIFQDHDGSLYLYYGGQGHCEVVRLTPDLKSLVPLPDGSLYKDITPPGYVEGPFMIERKGVYYLMWSEGDWGDSSYGVAYSKGTSPLGPFSGGGRILQTDPAVANGPGHHSVLQIPGTDDWYIVYHRHPLGTTGPNQRVMAIDQLHFTADGAIGPIRMTLEGPAARAVP